MFTSTDFLISCLAISVLYTWWLRRGLLKGIPIPVASASILWGHEHTIFQEPIGSWYGRWFKSIGPTYKIRAAGLKKDVLVTVDPAALHYIYTRNVYNYEHSPVFRPLIKRLLGEGLVWVEGKTEHQRMRSVVAPAFSLEHIRKFAPAVWETAHQLQIHLESAVSTAGNGNIVDISHWSSMATLDVFGKVGLSHDFQLGEGPDAKSIFKAWRSQVNLGVHISAFFAMVLLQMFPFLTTLPIPSLQAQGEIKSTIEVIARDLLLHRSAEDVEEQADILSLLTKAEQQKETKSKFSHHDVIENICTFAMVGHETVAGTLSYALYALARHPDVQRKLREELQSGPPNPTFEAIWSDDVFPYLGVVIREVCRMYPVAGHTEKVCQSDDVIPLKFPIPSADGKATIDSVKVNKGQVIYIPLVCVDRLCQVWGPTANEFRPERWLEPGGTPSTDDRTSGWSNLFVFSEGPRICIGWRLAILELKIFLLTLVQHFEFADVDDPVILKLSGTMLPFLAGRYEEGTQLRVRVTPLN